MRKEAKVPPESPGDIKSQTHKVYSLSLPSIHDCLAMLEQPSCPMSSPEASTHRVAGHHCLCVHIPISLALSVINSGNSLWTMIRERKAWRFSMGPNDPGWQIILRDIIITIFSINSTNVKYMLIKTQFDFFDEKKKVSSLKWMKNQCHLQQLGEGGSSFFKLF